MSARSSLRMLVLLLTLGAILAQAGPALAARCSGIDPARIQFCDDFDRHCIDPPVDPTAACPLGSAPDIASFNAVWPQQAPCSVSNTPIGLTTSNMWKPDGFAANVLFNIPTLPTHVATFPAPVNGAGPATVENPNSLKGQFFVHGPNTGAFANFVFYVELFLDDDRAPMDYVTLDCTKYNGEAPKYPILCQTNISHVIPTYQAPWGDPAESVSCPANGTTVHASFAFGLLAIVDNNPCDVDTGRRPTVYRAVVFDGVTWRQVRAPLFGIPSGTADMRLANGYNQFYYTIGEDTIELRLVNSSSAGQPNGYYVAQVPRQYTGPFNRIAMGPNFGRDLSDPENPSEPDCMEGGWVSNNMKGEEIVVYDGVTGTAEGACCLPNATCEQLDETACTSQGGIYHGNYVSCGSVSCCPIPFADSDTDGDVDQDDFATVQKCLREMSPFSEACECLNVVNTGTSMDIIDADDVGAFINCATGPSVQFMTDPNPNCIEQP